MACEVCKFSTERPRAKLRRELWEEDPRPIRTNTWHCFWDPQKYKNESPYEGSDPDFLKRLDEAREQDNNRLMYCDRFPKREVTYRYYQCGEFKLK